MYAKLGYKLQGNLLTLQGELDRCAVTEAIRRHEPKSIYTQQSEEWGWALLKQEILTALSAVGTSLTTLPLTIDLSGITKLDSIGLAALLHLIKTASTVRSPVKLKGLSEPLKKLLRVYNLEAVLAPYWASSSTKAKKV